MLIQIEAYLAILSFLSRFKLSAKWKHIISNSNIFRYKIEYKG